MRQLRDEQPVSADRLAGRREHLMTEITLERESAAHAHAARSAGSPRWRPRWARLLTASAAVTAATIGAFLLTSGAGGPLGHGPVAFSIEPQATGDITIHVVNSTVSAKEMTAQLHNAGLHITVDTLPVRPQLVGRWLVLETSQDVPSHLADDLQQQALGQISTLVVPPRMPGNVTLSVGRPARPGEALRVTGTPNALAPGGLLFCQRLADVPAKIAAERLTRAGYHVSVVGEHRKPLTPVPTSVRVATAAVSESDQRDVRLFALDPSTAGYHDLLATSWPPRGHTVDNPDYSSCPVTP